MRKMRDWREYLTERFAADREEAIGFLQAVLEDYPVYGNAAAVVSAIAMVVESQGGIAELAKKTSIDAHILSEVLSSDAAPRIDTLVTILNALGCRLSIEPLKDEERLSDLEPTAEMESSKFTNAETQLTGSNSPQ